ncbi:MAG: hypothetical protein H0U52_07835 [Chloroflexi bacterium]|nr:hypothetical protein [Chloroflexota bacterium]
MGDDRRDDEAERRRADVHSSVRIGGPAALTIVLVVLLILDVAAPTPTSRLGPWRSKTSIRSRRKSVVLVDEHA